MTIGKTQTLLAAVCDFGWGSMGKFRLVLDRLPEFEVVLYGESGINRVVLDLLGSRRPFCTKPPQDCDVALVINDPALANRVGDLGIPVVYVDSLPYLWATPQEVPERHKVKFYCAQRFPTDRLPVSGPLRDWHEIHWVDPIVPASGPHRGGDGVVINVGGLHSHLVGGTVAAYLNLVLIPLLEELKVLNQRVSAVCGNLPADFCGKLRELLPGCRAIGRQSPYEFEETLQRADLLLTSPGSTTILQAIALGLPTLLLPPQNLSQRLNMSLFSWRGAPLMSWPACVMSSERIEQLRPEGEDAVLAYFYRAICNAADSDQARAKVREMLRANLRAMPLGGVLDQSLPKLGTKGAEQIAALVRQAMLRRPEPADRRSRSVEENSGGG
jgi:hydroxymethylcytosylglucuronate/cytosylglucuronate synthase